MTSHLRANLILVGATLLLCSVAYPLVLLVAGMAFESKSNGGIVKDAADNPVGALLIAQEFKGDEYFQPRPSAAGYNASASGASNNGSNNPKLRDRVARQLGPIVRFRNGDLVGPLVERWFHEKPERLVDWAASYPALSTAWAKPDPANETVANWLGTDNVQAGFLIPAFGPKQLEKHAVLVKAWKEKHPDAPDNVAFFAVFSEEFPDAVPSMSATSISPSSEGSDIQAWFFDMWLQAHPDAATDLDPVPADMVTTSGSGLDPHITLRNARYQLKSVAQAWVEKDKKLDEKKVRDQLELLLNEKAFTPLLGFGGEPLVNVLEVNIEVRKKYGSAP